MTARNAFAFTLALTLACFSSHAQSQCDVKVYRDMLVITSGPACLSSSDGKGMISSGVKNVVQELNDDSTTVATPSGGKRQLNSREKLYRLAEIQYRDQIKNEMRMQNELRQTNRFARAQRGLEE